MISLRPAQDTDAQYFLALRREIQPELDPAEHEAWWRTVPEARFVAEDGHALVGVIRLADHPLVPGTGLVSLQVAKVEQGRGVGRAMLAAVQPLARAKGYTSLQARVEPGNLASQRAFLAAGYAPVRFEMAL